MTDLDMTDWPLVYIAGPYSNDPTGNTRIAIKWAEQLALLDVVPVVPHLSMLWDFYTPHPVEWWYAYDLAILARCDALFRLRGESAGADREVAFAHERGIPVFSVLDINGHFNGQRFHQWRRSWTPTGRYPQATPPKVAR